MSLLTQQLRKFGYKLRKLGSRFIRYAEKLDDKMRQRELEKLRAAGLTVNENGYLVISQEEYLTQKHKKVPGIKFLNGTQIVGKDGQTRATLITQRKALLDDDYDY